MKTATIKKQETWFATLVLTLLFQFALLGCGPEFDDPTMAEVKKPEILSIVLDPPEAAPGERVKVSFLMADERGVIEGNTNVWLPMGANGGLSEEEMVQALMEMSLEPNSLKEARLELTVPQASRFEFDEKGLAGMMIGLFAATGNTPDPSTPIEQILESLDALTASGDLKTAIRTLVVSEGSDPNQNPMILSIRAGDDHSQDTPVTTVFSADEDMTAARQLAAQNPVVVEEGQSLVFAADVEDDSDDELSLRYQWISTGGDFAGLREKVQEFEAPKYKELAPGDVDQTDFTRVNPRLDPNLHPVWLIVRDNGTPGKLGQSWAEFYIRVQPTEQEKEK